MHRPSSPQKNPYEAPSAVIDEQRSFDDGLWGGRALASRGARLAASLTNGIVGLLVAAPMFGGFALGNSEVSDIGGGSMMLTAMLGLALLGYNLYRLHTHGQTLGKQIMDIQIVRSDLQTPASLGRIVGLRIISMILLAMIPFVGSLIQLADPLFIFSNSRQCLHDLIADTNVVQGSQPTSTNTPTAAAPAQFADDPPTHNASW